MFTLLCVFVRIFLVATVYLYFVCSSTLSGDVLLLTLSSPSVLNVQEPEVERVHDTFLLQIAGRSPLCIFEIGDYIALLSKAIPRVRCIAATEI